VRVEMGEHIFLYDDRLVARYRDGELQYFHHNDLFMNLRYLRILAVKY
jgi:hypothetical protein